MIVKNLAQTNKLIKILIFFAAFVLSFFILIASFKNFALTRYADSESYLQFLIETPPRNFSVRPPAYPYFLKIANGLFGLQHLPAIQIIIFSITLGIIVVTAHNLFHQPLLNAFVAIALFFFTTFNLQVTQMVPFIAPEIILFFFTWIHVALIKKYIYCNKQISEVFVFLSCMPLFLTKPIFLYYPILLTIFLFFRRKFLLQKKIDQKFTFKTIGGLILALSSIAIVVGHNYYYQNKLIYSRIQEVNLVGKVLQYDLPAPKSAQAQYASSHQLVKQLKAKNEYNPWVLFTKLHQQPNNLPMIEEVISYAHKTVFYNFDIFFLKSTQLITEALSDQPRWPAMIFSEVKHSKISILEFRNGYYYRFYSQTLGKLNNQRNLFKILIGLTLISSFYGLLKNGRHSKLNHFLLYLIILNFYLFYILVFGAYEQYSRLRAPFDGLLLLTMLSSMLSIFNHAEVDIMQ